MCWVVYICYYLYDCVHVCARIRMSIYCLKVSSVNKILNPLFIHHYGNTLIWYTPKWRLVTYWLDGMKEWALKSVHAHVLVHTTSL